MLVDSVPWPDGREKNGKRARRKVEVKSIGASAKRAVPMEESASKFPSR